jgi:hypothetical protein
MDMIHAENSADFASKMHTTTTGAHLIARLAQRGTLDNYSKKVFSIKKIMLQYYVICLYLSLFVFLRSVCVSIIDVKIFRA